MNSASSLIWTTVGSWRYAVGRHYSYRIETRSPKAPPGFPFRAEVFRGRRLNASDHADKRTLAEAMDWANSVERGVVYTFAALKTAAPPPVIHLQGPNR